MPTTIISTDQTSAIYAVNVADGDGVVVLEGVTISSTGTQYVAMTGGANVNIVLHGAAVSASESGIYLVFAA